MYNAGMKDIPERVYIDSSVVSGLFDNNDHPEKVKPLWNAVKRGEIRIIVSDVLEREVKTAPQNVRDFFATLPESQIEHVVSSDASDALAERYITEGIVSEGSLNDSRHVALASVAHADVLVSFNCRHIVKLNRIRKYNAVNMLLGYPQIEIRTPDEVIQ